MFMADSPYYQRSLYEKLSAISFLSYLSSSMFSQSGRIEMQEKANPYYHNSRALDALRLERSPPRSLNDCSSTRGRRRLILRPQSQPCGFGTGKQSMRLILRRGGMPCFRLCLKGVDRAVYRVASLTPHPTFHIRGV